MSVRDYLVSIIRTTVPAVVGYLISLAAMAGVEIDAAALTPVVSGGFIGVYYAISRALEAAHPVFGVLLGYVAQPHYEE